MEKYSRKDNKIKTYRHLPLNNYERERERERIEMSIYFIKKRGNK